MTKTTLRVLLIEPNAEDIERITDLLHQIARFDFTITTLLSIGAITTVCENNDFDIVLLGLHVSEKNAVESINAINHCIDDIPIIVLTDFDDEDFSINAVHHGVQDYLIKSLLDAKSLVRSISYAMERNQLRVRLREQHERAEYLATHDELTDLPNRKLFQDRFDHQLARYERYHNGFAFMFIDLDNFKSVNDRFGHMAGDAVLQEVALRLKDHFRKTDTIARMGGDEFVLLVTHLLDVNNILIVVDKLMKLFEKPFIIDAQEINIYASIGVALIPQDGNDRETIFHKADTAMYRVKQAGGRGYQLYDTASIT